MEISNTAMKNAFRPLLLEDEKSMCPVFAMVKRQSQKITHNASEYAYITITSKGRLILYRFDDHSSYNEIYLLSTLMYGEVSQMQSGNYIAELSFLTDNGQKDINISFMPTVKDKDLPNQEKNSAKLYTLLQKFV